MGGGSIQLSAWGSQNKFSPRRKYIYSRMILLRNIGIDNFLCNPNTWENRNYQSGTHSKAKNI